MKSNSRIQWENHRDMGPIALGFMPDLPESCYEELENLALISSPESIKGTRED